MDIKELKTFAPLMYSLQKCQSNACRSILLSHLDEPSFNYVTKWMKKGTSEPSILNLSPNQLKKLKTSLEKDRKRVKYLTKPGGSFYRKRNVVKQSGEGIGLLLGVLAPVVIELVKKIIEKSKAKK